jgi:hypothetical protein
MAIVELKEEKVNIFPFSDNYAALQDVPIAFVCTVWENPKTGELWMLVFHEALYFGQQLKESLLCPNQMRAAGVTIEDAPIQVDASSSHSIKIRGTLEIPLEMHGVISHLRTRLPTNEEIELYREGQFQSVDLTEDTPWEPYSKEFARREDAARVARSILAIQVTSPRPKPSPRHASEEEEKEASSDDEAEEDNEEQDEFEFDNPFPFPRRPWDPKKEA